MCTMFADDTTIQQNISEFTTLMSYFDGYVSLLLKWCYVNRFDINCAKTENVA